jgi:hypothetical protein
MQLRKAAEAGSEELTHGHENTGDAEGPSPLLSLSLGSVTYEERDFRKVALLLWIPLTLLAK